METSKKIVGKTLVVLFMDVPGSALWLNLSIEVSESGSLPM